MPPATPSAQRIPDEIVGSLKTNISLLSLLRRYGIEAKKKGKGYKAICPFHDIDGRPEGEPSLSITPEKNEYHCFSCNEGGDNIRFVMRMEQVSFPQAVEKLLALNGSAVSRKSNKQEAVKEEEEVSTPEVQLGPAQRRVILENVVRRSVEDLRNSEPGRKYLESRGLDPLGLLDSYVLGFQNGRAFSGLADGERKKLRMMGLLKGNRGLFHNCVLFPLFKDGRVSTIYGRKVSVEQSAMSDEQEKKAPRSARSSKLSAHRFPGRHYLLPGKREGLYLPKQGLNPRKPVVITESVIDGLSLFTAGVTNVLPLLGVNGFLPDHLEYLKEQGFPKVFIALNGDQAGNRAAASLRDKLKAEGFAAEVIELPEGRDCNDMLREMGGEKLKAWITERVNAQKPGERLPTVWEDDDYLYLLFEKREYRVKVNNALSMDTMKVNVKVYDVDARSAFHVDTLDLYQQRGRSAFIGHTAGLFDLEREVITKDVNTIITILEERRLEAKRKHERGGAEYQMSEEERREALAYLKAPNLLDRIADDFATCGMVGNRNNCLLAYVISVSRLLPRALGALIVARSGAGKTYMQNMVASFTPEEKGVQLTRLTGQSLFYQGRTGLKNKLLCIEEDEGMKDGLYAIRTLLSSQRLQVHSVSRDPKDNQMIAYENTVEGPVSISISTTNLSSFDHETANRFLILHLDESREQTLKILRRRKLMAGVEGLRVKKRRAKIERLHRNVQRLLRPLAVSNTIDNDVEYPPEVLNTRRESDKFDTLVKTVALLHQYQRPLKEERFGEGVFKYIEVTQADVDAVLEIAGDVLRQSMDDLPKLCRELLVHVHEMVARKYRAASVANPQIRRWQITFTRKELKERCGWSRWHVEEHIKELIEAGYLAERIGRKGQRYAYSLVEDRIPEVPGLGGGKDKNDSRKGKQ